MKGPPEGGSSPPSQAGELVVLQSIFGDDFRELPPRKTAWGTEVDEGWWEIRLRPNEDRRVELTMRGRFTKKYPKTGPVIILDKPKGVTPDDLKKITKGLNKLIKSKEANPPPDGYIWDLADYIQTWLQEHKSLPEEGQEQARPNLLEEMELREEAQRAAVRAQDQVEEQQRLLQEEKERQLLTEKIQIDTSRKTERARQLQLEEESKRQQAALAILQDGELSSRLITLEEAISIPGFPGGWKTWILFGGKKESLWTTYTAEPDGSATEVEHVKADSPSISVQIIDFASSYYSTAAGQRQLNSLCNEALRLKEISSEYVVKIYGIHRTLSPKKWERLMIFTERLPDSGKLRNWLPAEGFGEDMAKKYIEEVLLGITDIHKRGANQKQIDLDLTLLCSRAPGDMSVKLAGTSYARRIIDYHRSNPFLKTYVDEIPESWRSPDEIDSPQTYKASRDVWNVGLLFIQLIFGPGSLLVFPNLPVLLQNSSTLSESTVEILNGLLHPMAKKRFSPEEALQKLRSLEETTRKGLRHTLNRSVSSNGAPASPHHIFGTSPLTGQFNSYFTAAQRYSRYRQDFDEVEDIGKGGFGKVVKARNKLDQRFYAIKKISLRAGDDKQKVLREIESLAALESRYIVRYYSCWLEELASEPEPVESPATTTDTAGSSTEEEEEVDSGMFKPFNINDLSFSRGEPSRSSSFPSVRFSADPDDDDDSGDDDDNEEDMSSESGSSKSDETIPDPSGHAASKAKPVAIQSRPTLTDSSTDVGSYTSTLYIQMEFVERQTLREAIEAGLSDDEVWKYLKQVLEALSHLSVKKIVHRDLKPNNILLDYAMNAKIADFGLSTSQTGDEIATAIHQQLTITDGDADRTSNIGTAFYIAPEVAISKNYNEKADMYSLGIILFEMCYKFKTASERAHVLTALRTPAITFPMDFPADRTAEKEIIKMLLSHDPSMRPTASQLLGDHRIPRPEREQQYTADAIAALTNPNSAQYPDLVDALFNRSLQTFSTGSDNRHDDYTYDNEHDDELQVWLTIVTQRLVQLFQRHGAVETYIPLLVPETTLLSAFPSPSKRRPAKVLDQAGKLTRLPDNGLLAMARSATRRKIERIKRYHVGYRYGEHPAGGQPTATGELCFDIISPIRSFAADTELLEVVDKMISEFRGTKNSALDYEFHVSHEGVLAVVLGSVPDRQRSAVLRALKELSASSSGNISGTGSGSAELRTRLGLIGLSKMVIDDLEQCCIPDDFDKVRHKLESLFHSTSARKRLSAAVEEVSAIVKLARSCGINRKVLFRPVMARHAEMFRGGFMFECVRKGKIRDTIAYGGRYDSLLEHFKEPAQQTPSRRVYGVGMSIALDSLARVVKRFESTNSIRLMEKDNELERSFGFWTPARCDVYVVAVSGVDLSARLAMTGELWRAGIRADLQYEDERSLPEVERECLDQNTLFLVIPRSNRMAVKVRAVLRKTEEEVPRPELTAYLRNAIAEQRRIDATYASAEGSIPSAQAIALGSGMPNAADTKSSELDIRLVLPPEPQVGKSVKGRPVRKHRHATKSVYYDKASEFAASFRTNLPIIGLDLPLPILSNLALDTAWIDDDESWRSILASMSVADRKYAEQVRDAVREVRDEGIAAVVAISSGNGSSARKEAGLWLYNVREARGFLLQLGK